MDHLKLTSRTAEVLRTYLAYHPTPIGAGFFKGGRTGRGVPTSLLQRLECMGVLTGIWLTSKGCLTNIAKNGGRRRHLYHLTPAGVDRAKAYLARYEEKLKNSREYYKRLYKK